jgi:drug/metabolite transporter (DMT)-like permease
MNFDWYYYSILSALLSATCAVMEKKQLFSGHPLEFSFAVSVFNLLIILPVAFVSVYYGNVFETAGVVLLIIFIKVIFTCFGYLYVMYGIKHLQLSASLPLLLLTPAFVALFSFLLFGTVLDFSEILGLFLLFAGTYLLNQISNHKKILEPFYLFFRSKGYVYIIIALCVFTLSSLLDKVLLHRFRIPVFDFIIYQHLLSPFVFLLILYFRGMSLKSGFLYSKENWRAIMLISLVTILYRFCHFFAITKTGSVALALSLKRISVFFAAVIGGKIFNEDAVFFKALSILLMFLGVTFIIF